MAKLPYFPFDAKEYLVDDKIPLLNFEEKGLLIDLWCHMWLNKVKRGHLLYCENGKPTLMPDQNIAKLLQISTQRWSKLKQKLTKEVPVLQIGKHEEVYSPRLSNYKTQYELYEKPSGKIRKPSGTIRRLIREESVLNKIRIRSRIRNRIELEGTGKESEKKDCPHCGQKEMVIQKDGQTTILNHECKR